MSTLDELFETARQHESALNLALRVHDDATAAIECVHLRQALGRMSRMIDRKAGDNEPLRRSLTDVFVSATQRMRCLLESAPVTIAAPELGRFQRWTRARTTTLIARNGPHIFELDAAGHELQEVVFFSLHVASSRFITNLRRATFWDTFIEGTDFNYSRLDNSDWKDTCVTRSFFRDSSFQDAVFQGCAFFACDFTNVDFSTTHDRPMAAGGSRVTQFVRCNMTGTTWNNRNLSNVDFFGCTGIQPARPQRPEPHLYS